MLRKETLPHGTRLIDLGVFQDNLKQCSKCNSGTQLLSLINHLLESKF